MGRQCDGARTAHHRIVLTSTQAGIVHLDAMTHNGDMCLKGFLFGMQPWLLAGADRRLKDGEQS